ncbi:MAG: type I pullulanase [Muribaculaceae bacterium]|nr:type I pullulanase [Muribaculaceae bacterium]
MKKILLTAIIALTMATAGARDYNFNEMTYTPKATEFFLNTNDDAQAVTVRIYDSGKDGNMLKKIDLKRVKGSKSEWSGKIKGDLKGKFYTFDVKYNGAYMGENPGIFAKAVGVNGRRGAIIDMAETNPEGWDIGRRSPLIALEDHIIYEMHHRDFSIDPSSGLQYKGKFLALTEPKAIEHLKSLGVNTIHILPSYDYASINEERLADNRYNWGYDPLNYNVPEGGYSTNPYDPATRIREFKQMVQALHKAGFHVVLDVVYNHTYNIGDGNFQKTCPDTFYRKNPDGSWSNGSGCGNETASERDIMRAFMLASVKYWMEEYGIDGFRFDLMGVHDIETMNAIADMVHKKDPNRIVYGEGWSAGPCAIPSEIMGLKANIKRMPGIAAFSDDIRDALRGPWDGDDKAAFLGGIPGYEESLKFGIAGASQHPQIDYSKVNYSKEPFANNPNQMIAYVSCHDDMCLVDRLKASIPGLTEKDLIKLDLMAQTAIFTSRGIPFMLSGEEMLRNKKGVHNSFESPDSINHLDWNNLKRYPQVFNYYKNLIALRKNHHIAYISDPKFKRTSTAGALEFLPGDECLVVYRYKNLNELGDKWNNMIVILNGNNVKKTVKLPKSTYTIVGDGDVINEDGIYTLTTDEIIAPPRSAIIMHD